MTTRLYSHTDTSAPAHSGSGLGQILTILRACLVDGYGTRTPAGWTMPFSDLPNNKAVFRGNSNSGDYFRIDDNLDHEYSNIRGFETMSDVDTGTEEYPNDSDLVASNSWKCINREGTNTLHDAWYLIASEEFCYIIFYGDTNYSSIIFFGEYERNSTASTVPNYAVAGLDYNSTVSASILEYGFLQAGTTQNWLFQRRNEWNDKNRNIPLDVGFDKSDYTQPNPLDGKFYFQKLRITDTSAPYVRWGKFKDILVMEGGNALEFFDKIGELMVIESENYITMKSFNGYLWAFRFDVSEG